MRTERTLIDTGPLVALLVSRDPHHQSCMETLGKARLPLYSCWAVLTEAAWLTRKSVGALDMLMEFIERGWILPLHLNEEAAPWLRDFFIKYRDLRPQLADACLCYLAEQENIRTIFTLDRRDFSVFVDRHGKAFLLVPETLGP